MYADPSGTFVLLSFLIGMGIAATIGALAGATVYVASVSINYFATGNWNWSWAQFGGATLGGAIGGALTMIPYFGPMLIGFITGASSTAISMILQNLYEGTEYSPAQIAITSLIVGAASAATAGIMDKIKFFGINTGRNSYEAIFKQIRTKFWNGTISRISGGTFTKMLALQLYGSMLGFAADTMLNQYDVNAFLAEFFNF